MYIILILDDDRYRNTIMYPITWLRTLKASRVISNRPSIDSAALRNQHVTGSAFSNLSGTALYREALSKGMENLGQKNRQDKSVNNDWSVGLPLGYVHKITSGAVLGSKCKVQLLRTWDPFWILNRFLLLPLWAFHSKTPRAEVIPWSLSSSTTACQTVAATLALSRLAFNADHSSRD